MGVTTERYEVYRLSATGPDSPGPLDTKLLPPRVSASLSGGTSDIGAERAENRVSESGAVSGRYGNR